MATKDTTETTETTETHAEVITETTEVTAVADTGPIRYMYELATIDPYAIWTTPAVADATDLTYLNALMMTVADVGKCVEARIADTNTHLKNDNTIFPFLMRVNAVAVQYAIAIGCPDPWVAQQAEYDRAKAKHGDHTLDNPDLDERTKYMALAEEVGEVAAALTYDNDDDTGHNADLTAEVIQIAGLAAAWAYCFRDLHAIN